MSRRETMAVMTMSGQSYLGSTRILRPGADVPPEANLTDDLPGH
jgi:hypothetical protein